MESKNASVWSPVAGLGAETSESTEAWSLETRVYPLREALKRLGVKETKGYDLVKTGELQTFLIGRHRYATEGELRRFVRSCIQNSVSDDQHARFEKVKSAVAGRAKKRKEKQRGGTVDSLKRIDPMSAAPAPAPSIHPEPTSRSRGRRP